MNTDERARGIAERIGTRPILVIGLGGIGIPVTEALARFLTFARTSSTMFLVDGDAFEERNRERVAFEDGGNKALSKARELNVRCDGQLPIVPVPKHVTPRNAHRLIDERSIVFLAVDNHATRRCVNDRCRKLSEVLLISGGNDGVEEGQDGTFGNVMIYERTGGRDVTPPLTRFHPEIARPGDKRPDQLGCAARLRSAPQLLFTNLAVASTMLGVFHAWLLGRITYDEIFLDIVEARMQPVSRQRGTQDSRPDRPTITQSPMAHRAPGGAAARARATVKGRARAGSR